MNKVFVPEGYRPVLNTYETQLAIGTTKRLFADVKYNSIEEVVRERS